MKQWLIHMKKLVAAPALLVLSPRVLWLTIRLLICQIEVVRKSLYVVASYRGITVFTEEIRKKIRTRILEYPITLIFKEEKVSSFKN